MEWHKISSNKEEIKMNEAETKRVGEIEHKTLLLKSLSAQNAGSYKCNISFLGYRASGLVNISVKGNNHYIFLVAFL
jgi:hypothetical protein